MKRVYYDLHLHSCLSPCGSSDMTPNNIVNMAKLLGYDMIALTDHNSCLNCEATVTVGKRNGLIVVPGMELCTAEDAHTICLFPTVAAAMEFHQYVKQHSPTMSNDAGTFGKQMIMNDLDEPIGEETQLLINAANIGIDDVVVLVNQYHGAAFPAHIDRSAYSVFSTLGAIPPEANFKAAEITPYADEVYLLREHDELRDKILLRNSDAHYLEHMLEPNAWLALPECTPECLIAALNGEIDITWK